MKNILLYTLLLTVAISYGQGLLSEERVQQKAPQSKKYDYIGRYSEGLASAFYPYYLKSGFIDKSGKVVIPFKYDHVS